MEAKLGCSVESVPGSMKKRKTSDQSLLPESPEKGCSEVLCSGFASQASDAWFLPGKRREGAFSPLLHYSLTPSRISTTGSVFPQLHLKGSDTMLRPRVPRVIVGWPHVGVARSRAMAEL